MGRKWSQAGDVVVIRHQGPKGGPAVKEMLAVTGAMKGAGRGAEAALVVKLPPPRYTSGALAKFGRLVTGTNRAVTESCVSASALSGRRIDYPQVTAMELAG